MHAPDSKEPFDGSPYMEMLAKAVPWATFNAAQRQAIKQSLAAVGVDLDTATVEELCGPREWWGWEPGKDYIPEQVPLRHVLQEWAYAAAKVRAYELKPLTPKQYAEKLRREVAALGSMLPMLDPINGGPVGGGFPSDEQMDTRRNRGRVLQAAIRQKITERQECIAKLEAAGSSSKQNARTKAAEYWDVLVRKWLEATKGRISKHRQKYLLSFLHACSQSLSSQLIEKEGQKLSKQELERELDRKLSNFVRNYGSV
jgi:hypothetical protein